MDAKSTTEHDGSSLQIGKQVTIILFAALLSMLPLKNLWGSVIFS